MKILTKLLPLMLAALLLLAACTSASPSATAEPTAAPTPEAVEATAEPTAEPEGEPEGEPDGGDDNPLKLLSPGKLVIGSSPDYPPYESYEGETLVGFDIELMTAVCDIMGLEIEWSPMEFDTILMAMESGQVDCGVSGFTWSQDREDSGILFSTPYVDSSQVVFVLDDSDIQSVDDLHGKKVYASLGTTGAMALEDLGFDDMDITYGSDYQMAFQMLAEGQVDGVAVDAGVGQSHIDNGRPFRGLEPPLLEEENHVVFAPGMEALKAEVDAAITQYMATAEYKALREKFGL